MATTKAKRNYFARVELHGAEWPDDYEELYEELAKVGFKPCITLRTGNSKKLPTGFYFANQLSARLQEVSSGVCAAADATGYENEITVVQSGGSRSRLSSDCDEAPAL